MIRRAGRIDQDCRERRRRARDAHDAAAIDALAHQTGNDAIPDRVLTGRTAERSSKPGLAAEA
jgi:hypothetical protein